MTQTSDATSDTFYPKLAYDDAPAAIDGLERAFGFVRRLVVPGLDGTVAHSELTLARVSSWSRPRSPTSTASDRGE